MADYLSGLATAEGATMPKSNLSTYPGINKDRLIQVMDPQMIDYLGTERNIVIDNGRHHVQIKNPPAAKVNGATEDTREFVEVSYS